MNMTVSNTLSTAIKRIKKQFGKDYSIHWSSLTLVNNSLILVNISLFFVTELVKQGYYFTYYSLFFLALVQLCILIPVGLTQNIRFYLMTLILEFIGIYFIIASVVFWLGTQ